MASVLVGAPMKMKWDERMISRPGKLIDSSHFLYPFLPKIQVLAVQ